MHDRIMHLVPFLGIKCIFSVSDVLNEDSIAGSLNPDQTQSNSASDLDPNSFQFKWQFFSHLDSVVYFDITGSSTYPNSR